MADIDIEAVVAAAGGETGERESVQGSQQQQHHHHPMTDEEIRAAMESEVEEHVALVLKHNLTIPHREPLNNESVGKRQLRKLPCFTTLLHVPLPQPQGDVIVAGRRDGQLVQWWLNGFFGNRAGGGGGTSQQPGKVPGGTRNGYGKESQTAATATSFITSSGGTAAVQKQTQLQMRQHDDIQKHEPFTIGTHKGNVTCLAYATTPKLLLSGSSDCCIKLWDMMASDPSTARCTQTLNAHDSTVTAIAVHCNLVFSGSIDKTLKVWRFEEGRDGLCFPWAVVRQVFIFDSWVTSLWASPHKIAETSQGEVFAGDSNGGITVLRSTVTHDAAADSIVATSVELLRHIPHVVSEKKQAITKILPIPNLNLVISLSYESVAQMTDIVGFNKLVAIPHPDKQSGRFIDVVWNGANEEVILLDNSGIVFIWDSKLNRMRNQQQLGYNSSALAAIYTKSDNTAESFAAIATLWMAERESVRGLILERTSSMVQHKGHSGRILAMALPSNGNGLDEEDTTDVNRSGPPGQKSILSAGGLGDDLSDFFLATASVDNTICLWNSNMSLLKQYTEKYSEISAFLALPHRQWLVSGHENGSLKFWSLVRDRTFRFMAHENTVSAVCEGFHRCNPRGEMEEWDHLFSVSYDGFLAVWDLPLDGSKAKCEGRVRVSNSELISAAYDSIKKCYIVGGNAGDITIWSVDELKPLKSLCQPIPAQMKGKSSRITTTTGHSNSGGGRSAAHTEAVTCLAMDGNYLFSGGEDERLYLWNTMGGGELLKSMVYLTDLGTEAEVGEIQQFVVHPGTGDLIACTRTGLIVVFSQETGMASAVYSLQDEVSAIAFNRDSEEVVAGMDDGVILRVHLSRFRPLVPSDVALEAAAKHQAAVLHPDSSEDGRSGSATPAANTNNGNLLASLGIGGGGKQQRSATIVTASQVPPSSNSLEVPEELEIGFSS